MNKDMLSNDLKENVRDREQIRQSLHEAAKENDTEAFVKYFEELTQRIGLDIKEEIEQKYAGIKGDEDDQVLMARGLKPLTAEEKVFYQKFGECIKSKNPRQALNDVNLVLPDTTINRVFDELRTEHPLLRRLNFIPSGAVAKIIVNKNGYQTAAWGELCSEIVKELLSGFAKMDATLDKLSAFLPVCKDMLEFGPIWLDEFVRQVLLEAFANGMEEGVVTGTGKDMPIGMDRQVGDNVTVTGGVYPRKAKIKVNDLSVKTIGNLLGTLAVDPNGKPRRVQDVILLVNPQDYFRRIMPATTIMAPDGTFRNNVLPWPIDIIQSLAVPMGEAIIGLGYRYLLLAGSSREGRIEYSDEYQFLEDKRVYLIKGHANGMAMDNNAFLLLDISDLEPIAYKVTMVEQRTPSTDATLNSLRLGALTLSPTFDAATTTYTAATTNASNTITAIANDAGADVEITVGDEEIANGTAAEWATGANTVTIRVTAEDGSTTKTYTVTVTKS